MSATCHVAKEQLEVLRGRSPLGVVPSSVRPKTLLSSQPSGGTDMSATCHVAEEQLGVLPG